MRTSAVRLRLIAIVKKEVKLEASLYTCLQILSLSIFEKNRDFLRPSSKSPQIRPTGFR